MPDRQENSPPEGSTERVWQWLLSLRGAARAVPFARASVTETEQACIDLYERFARRDSADGCVVAHLGQSVDGYVATDSGDSYYVTGPENIDHLHRMRALADAVVVGSGTIEADDPELTTRRVAGPNPTRVVLDGRARLSASHRVFSDRAARTIVVCCSEQVRAGMHGAAEVLGLPSRNGAIDLALLIAELSARGLRRVFIEGGGTVVSAFLEAGILDRLQLAIAPVLIGAGRPGIRAPARERLLECLRPQHRLYLMGEDLLFDYDLRSAPVDEPTRNPGLQRLR